MNNVFQDASEAEDIPYEGKQARNWRKTRLTDEGLTTPGTAFTSPWIGASKSPDTCFVNTVTQMALSATNANKHPDSIDVLTNIMPPADKVDSWFASTSAGPSQSSTSRPNTRDTALTSNADIQSQLSSQKAEDAAFDTTVTCHSMQAPSADLFLDTKDQPALAQMDGSTEAPTSSAANRSENATSHSGTGGHFFDSVPKGPSQLSTSRWEAIAPVCDREISTCGQDRASPGNQSETPFVQAQRVEVSHRPRLSLRIPNTSRSSGNFRSAPEMATCSEISDLEAAAPHTTKSLVPTARLPTILRGPQRQASQRQDTLNPVARPFQSKITGPRALPRRNNHTVMQPTVASYSNSKTWTSPLTVEKERWQRVEESLERMNLLRSSVVPKTLKDWLAHQRERTDAKKDREQKKLEDMNLSVPDPRLPPPDRPVKVESAFRGRAFEHKNRSSVLVFESVWTRTYEPPAERPGSLWPCDEEMREEGDERNTSGFRRFPALPRVPGNDTVQYKLKGIQHFLPFDAIWTLPTKASVQAANEKSSPEEIGKMEGYLGRSLLDALDCITNDIY